MDFYIGQIFDEMYPSEAAEWCDANNAMMVEITPVIRVVVEEYETTEIQDMIIPAITHIETDENGVEYEIIDEPERKEQREMPVVKTREVEKEIRRFEIVAIPEPTVEEKNKSVKQTRAYLYSDLIDPLHAEKQRKVVLGTWTEADEEDYVAEVKRLTEKIQTENPYIE